MYGHPDQFRPPGGGGRRGQPPSLTPNPNFYHHNPAFQYFHHNLSPSLQPCGYPVQDPNFFVQNPNLPVQNLNFTFEGPISAQNPNFSLRPRLEASPQSPGLSLERIERAVVRARWDLHASGESVSAWKVSQAVVSALRVDSWSSLGFQMQEIPSLHRLMLIEGKINAFIHCFVGVWGITTLHDLQAAICRNEGVENFEDLELGPLLRHPLVLHYFSVNTDKVFKITSAEIISYLCEFLDAFPKNDVKVEEFLDFIAMKRSMSNKEMLMVRIQSLGMHIFAIREAKRLEDNPLKKFLQSMKQKANKKIQKRPLLSSEKKLLDERFSVISERIKLFSSAHEDFSGKHTRFLSSSSEDEDSDEDRGKDIKTEVKVNSNMKHSEKNDRVSSCPYPSVTEEMERLGLKSEVGTPSSVSGLKTKSEAKHNLSSLLKPRGRGKKKKSANANCSMSAPTTIPQKGKKRKAENAIRGSCTPKKKPKKEDKPAVYSGMLVRDEDTVSEDELILDASSMRMFIGTWKETCRDLDVAKALMRMLQSYNIRSRERRRLTSLFAMYPFIGLLNVAVISIKNGMWDNIYDALQAIDQGEVGNTVNEANTEYETIDVQPDERISTAIQTEIADRMPSVPAEDIISKIAAFFKVDYQSLSKGRSLFEKKYTIFKKLYDCEAWLVEQLSVKNFSSLGFGGFSTFIEKHFSSFPKQFCDLLHMESCKNTPLEACMRQHQLVMLVSQASSSLWEDEAVTKQMILTLLRKQFPLLDFRITENGSMEDFLDAVKDYRNNLMSKCVIYSAALFGSSCKGQVIADVVKLSEDKVGTSISSEILAPVTSKEAASVLLKAPMLADLISWSNWDQVFAPSLGPLMEFLLNEINSKELLCLATRDGKVLRVDQSATVDSFLAAALIGSSFLTALQLVSLISVVGGEKHVPLSLLKCHSCRAFEVIKLNFQGAKVSGNTKEKVLSPSRFFLESLGYIPADFRAFAADVFFKGLRSVVKDAPSAVLEECDQLEHRIMLHGVGLSLGIVEWIHDYNSFTSDAESVSSATDCRYKKVEGSDYEINIKHIEGPVDKKSSVDDENVRRGKVEGICSAFDGAVDVKGQTGGVVSVETDAPLLIESIRQDEFGLNPTFSATESSMLKKQHARLGRALHCLSRELYSQDSHFLLELVQNADDNTYPENVEPTLILILQGSGIIVLNNERGFSAANIRALCDVGNSTKKRSTGGYIGQKGIGFKSVFRVTDAPEIHSNGFHIKFDISEGQIGFVLPTLVPACNIDFYCKLASGDDNPLDHSSWNTCIVLPFKSQLLEGNAMSGVMTKFSDLHPSLLLFLHRLKCIKFRNMLDDSLVTMRKEVLENGLVRVSHGKERMTWLVVSEKLQADFIRHDVQLTEIALAFTLKESEDGYYIPSLEQQPVFAFLPLRTYGLKFILQGDFVLPSSREEVDGDSPWNQWLLSEFPSLFVRAEESFCALPCFRENKGRAVSAYMSFVPLIGEVHGFFSCLPRMIISKLRMSNCLLLDGENWEWIPPCKALRGWDEQAQKLFSNSLLRDHLGIGFLNKDIILSDQLARALGVEEYGLKTLVRVISSLCEKGNGVQLMGLDWLFHWLNALYSMSLKSSSGENSEIENDLIKNLKKIAFIPLSDGTFSSLLEGTIWLHTNSMNSSINGDYGSEASHNICCKLRIVNPSLFSSSDMHLVDNVTKILQRIGVQRLSAHEIIRGHILPALCDERNGNEDQNLMIECICFVMVHLQSNCPSCRTERESIIYELRNKALILTNYGFKRPVEVPIHFSEEYGNPIKIDRLVNPEDMRWHEVDKSYLVHPMNDSHLCGLKNWRDFFQELGITDFVQVAQVERHFTEISHMLPEISLKDMHLIGPGSVGKDWESNELVNLLSLLAKSGNPESCKYLLDILDLHWDSLFCDKVMGHFHLTSTMNDPVVFESSFLRHLRNVQWVVSSMDNELHYASDLFHDCDSVRSVLGHSAPYAVPQVRSTKLRSGIGFKTKVTLNDVLAILDLWRRSETSFNASIAQMSRLYTFVWNKLAYAKGSIASKFKAQKFIFVPSVSVSRHDSLVPGLFCSPEEVYWHDSTGVLDQMNEEFASDVLNHHVPLKTIHNIYSGLHDFFVIECGVPESPRFDGYVMILQRLSKTVLPSQAAHAVYKIFQKWNEELNSGSLDAAAIGHLRESLTKTQFMVLPTVQDKWVSLHPSFGLICWVDDKKLYKEFKNLMGIDFLRFCEPSEDDELMLPTRMSNLLRALGIPALSEVITPEAKYEGPSDSSLKASLINWALPYAQRYLYCMHSEKYSELKESGFDNVNNLQVLVVEKLSYRNLVKCIKESSKKLYNCSSILQGNTLYVAHDSEMHAVFLELSRLFFCGTPNLYMANFLHMIMTMAESGSPKSLVEKFVLDTQKVSELPAEEPVWSIEIPRTPLPKGPDESLPSASASTAESEQTAVKSNKRKASWPPIDWKTAPDFKYARQNGLRSRAASSGEVLHQESKDEDSEVIIAEVENAIPDDINVTLKVMADSESPAAEWIPLESNILEDELAVDSNHASDGPGPSSGPGSLKFYHRDQLNTGAPDPAQAILTGRLGELAAYKYFSESFGSQRKVNWVNEVSETGLPYDILIGDHQYNREYIEVKATTSSRKDWFKITLREWQFAIEMGDLFSVAHVVLKDKKAARVSVFRNPLKLCQQGKLQLVLLMPKESKKEFSVAAS
ncbi:protein NO VEIN isoform X1 [Punica granatum]|uniref:Protein NO VEIN isoform X1 n=1 Tax=Punica granatum TaxID=22663 RepID=A0A6P8EB75_PUNGR|nr:protein NO VEIN isoform X1 [Punica granatum]